MSRMNKVAQWLIIIWFIASLLSAIVPYTDFDSDGLFDSFITDGLLLLPVFLSVISVFGLLTMLSSTCMSVPYLLTCPIILPPISPEI